MIAICIRDHSSVSESNGRRYLLDSKFDIRWRNGERRPWRAENVASSSQNRAALFKVQ